jgi:dienelactone hydrolase
MSRRQFAAGALAASIAPRAPARQASGRAGASRYQGPLSGLEERVAGRQLDSLEFTRAVYPTAPLRLRFRATTRNRALAWQKRLRAKLMELMGGLPPARCPLRAETIETRDLEGYRREKVVFQSRPDLSVFAYLLVPERGGTGGAAGPGSGRLPAVICLPGHGRGCDPVAGVGEDGDPDTTDKEYQHSFGVQAARHGFLALVVEQLGFGCRRDPAARKKGLGTSSCQPAAGAALLLGQTMAAWRVYDVIRAIDYLASRPEADAGRIACMGISGGGTVTLYAAAVEPRIRAVVLSGSFASYRDSIFSIAHCIDNYIPGILNWAEMSDVAGLIAPRPVFVESGERDDIFPVDSARTAVAELRRIYGVFRAEQLVGHEVFPGPHSFWGKGAFTFLRQHLVES